MKGIKMEGMRQVFLSKAMVLATKYPGIPFCVDSLNFDADIDSSEYPTRIYFSNVNFIFFQQYPFLLGVKKTCESYPYGDTNAEETGLEYDVRYKTSKLDLSYSENEWNDVARYTLELLAEENPYAWVRESWLD
jgi:hypothetical protein